MDNTLASSFQGSKGTHTFFGKNSGVKRCRNLVPIMALQVKPDLFQVFLAHGIWGSTAGMAILLEIFHSLVLAITCM